MDSITQAATAGASQTGADAASAASPPSVSQGDLQSLLAPDPAGLTNHQSAAAQAPVVGPKQVGIDDMLDLLVPSTQVPANTANLPQLGAKNPFVSNLSRKDKLAALMGYTERPSVNMAGLTDQAIDASYSLTQAAKANNLKPLFLSAAGGAGHVAGSLHGSGQAVDMRLLDSKGNFLDPHEEQKALAALAHQTGWAGMLDEVNQPIPGVTQGPNMHLTVGRKDSKPDYILDNPKIPYFSKLVNPSTSVGAKFLQKAGDSGQGTLQSLAESMAVQNGIDPNIFKQMIKMESGWNPNAISPVGARGLGQLMPGTNAELAKRYGVDPNKTDGSPTQQLLLSAKYVQEHLAQNGGNYARTFAAYNAGPGNLQKFIQNKGGVFDETAHYVYNILHQFDPTINSVSDAKQAIVNGTGMVQGPHNQELADAQTQHIIRQTATALDNTRQVDFSKISDSDFSTSLKNLLNPLRGDGTKSVTGYAAGHSGNGGFLDAAKGALQATFDPSSPTNAYDFLAHSAYTALDGLLFNALPDDPYYDSLNKVNSDTLPGGLSRFFAKAGNALPYAAASIKSFDSLSRGLSLVGEGLFGPGQAAVSQIIGEGENAVNASARYLLGQGTNAGYQSIANVATSSFMDGFSRHFLGWLGNQGDPNHPDSQIPVEHAFASAGMAGVLNGMVGATGHFLTGNGLGTIFGHLAQTYGENGVIQTLSRWFNTEASPLQRAVIGAGHGFVLAPLAAQVGNELGLTDVDPYTAMEMGVLGGAALGGSYSPLMQAAGLDKVVDSFASKAGIMADALAEKYGKKLGLGIAERQADIFQSQQITTDQMHRNLAEAYLNKVEPHLQEKEQMLNENLVSKLQQATQEHQAAQQAVQGAQAKVQALTSDPNGRVTDYLGSQKQLAQIMDSLSKMDPKTQKGAYETGRLQAKSLAEKVKAYEQTPGIQQFISATSSLQDAQGKFSQIDGFLNGPDGKDLQNVIAGSQAYIGQVKNHADQIKAAMADSELWEQYKQNNYTVPNSTKMKTIDFHAPVGVDEDSWKAMSQSQAEFALYDKLNKVSGPVAPSDFGQTMSGEQAKFISAYGGKAALDKTVASKIPQMQAELDTLRGAKAKGRDIHTSDKAAVDNYYQEMGALRWAEAGKSTTLVDAPAAVRSFLQENPTISHADLRGMAASVRTALKAPGDTVPLATLSGRSVSQEVAVAAQAAVDHGQLHVPVDRSGVFYKELQDKIAAGRNSLTQDAISATEAQIKRYSGLNNVADTLEYRGSGDGERLQQYSQPYRDLNDPYNKTALADRLIDRTREEYAQEIASVRGPVNPNDPIARRWATIQDIQDGKAPPETVAQWNEMLGQEAKVISDLGSMTLNSKMSPQDAAAGAQMVNNNVAVLSSMRAAVAQGVDNLVPDSFNKSREQLFNLLANDKALASSANRLFEHLKDSGTVKNPQELAIKQGHILVKDLWASGNQIGYVVNAMEEKARDFYAAQSSKLPPELQKTFYKDLAHAGENSTAAREFFKKYPGVAEETFAVNRHLQATLEDFRQASPELLDVVRENFVMHSSPEMRDLRKVTRGNKNTPVQVSSIASEEMRKYQTLKEKEDVYQSARQKLDTLGGTDPIKNADYYRMTPPQQAKYLHQLSDDQWNSFTLQDKNKMIDSASKFMGQLLSRPEYDPAELYGAQFRSMAQAAPIRRFFKAAQMSSIMGDTGQGEEAMQLMHYVGDNQALGVVKEGPYRRLSEIPSLANLKIVEPGPEQSTLRNAGDFAVHPELFKLLQNYFDVKGTAQPTMFRRVMNAFRSNAVLGGVIPHLFNVSGSTALEYAANPLRAAGLSEAGRLVRKMGEEAGDMSYIGNALRAGLNPRIMEQSVKQVCEGIVQAMGPDMANEALGLERGSFGKILQAMDETDPNRQQALEWFRQQGGLKSWIADTLTVPTALQDAYGKMGLYKQIQNMQLAGYHMRAVDLFSTNPELAKIQDTGVRWQQAQSLAADMANRASGALPFWMFSANTRNLAYNTLMSPSWFMSRATAIVDALPFFGDNKFGQLVGKAQEGRYAHLSPEAQAAMKNRLRVQVGTGLAISLGGSVALSTLLTGRSPFDNPDPSTWFKIPVGNVYVNGPVQGLVRDIVKFTSEALPTAFGKGDGIGKALQDTIMSSIAPSWKEAAAVMTGDAQTMREQGTDPDASWWQKALDVVGHAARGAFLPDPELAGLTSRRAQLSKLILPPTGDRSGEYTAMRMTPAQYVGQLLGIYENHLVGPKDLRGEDQMLLKELQDTAKAHISRYLDAANEAEDPEVRDRMRNMAYNAMAQGVQVPDRLRRVFNQPIYRLDPKEWESMVDRYYHPGAVALNGLQSSGRSASLYATLRQEMLDQQDYDASADKADYLK